MAAPFFCSHHTFTLDLQRLGYPAIDSPDLYSPDSRDRLSLLAWLAEQVDPTFDLSSATIETLARLWDRIGVHTALVPNGTGHFVPLTAPNRPAFRAAALVFLRAAVDLALAMRWVRRGREMPLWMEGEEAMERESVEEKENQFDCDMLLQMDQLIAKRHQLFPHAHQANQPSKPKAPRRPLIHRSTTSPNIVASLKASAEKQNNSINNNNNDNKGITHSVSNHNLKRLKSRNNSIDGNVNNNNNTSRKPRSSTLANINNTKPNGSVNATKTVSPNSSTGTKTRRPPKASLFRSKSRREPGGASRKTPNVLVSPREVVLERLRTMRKDVKTFNEMSTSESNENVIKENEQYQPHHSKDEQTQLADALAEEADKVAVLAQAFDHVVDEAAAMRGLKGERAERDVTMEGKLSKRAGKLRQSATKLLGIINAAGRARDFARVIEYYSEDIRYVPESADVRAVEQLQRRTERHL